jgi:hypothetical protein
VGQFTGLFNGLEKAEPKQQPKAKTDNAAKRSAAKQINAATEKAPAKALRNAKAKPNDKPTNGNAATTAPMRGKRSHPAYTQAPAFVRKDTYKAVKIALLNDERSIDYSDLVEELLTAWLKNKR